MPCKVRGIAKSGGEASHSENVGAEVMSGSADALHVGLNDEAGDLAAAEGDVGEAVGSGA